MIPRSPYLTACNDNRPAVDMTRFTLMGFAVALIGTIGAFTLIACGVLP